MKFATKAVHAGNEAEPVTGAVMPPIYMTSTFKQESPGIHSGYEYTRANNPNFVVLEKLLAALEDARHATVFSSGLGALTGMVSTLSKGDRVVAMNGLYGGTYRLFKKVFNRFGVIFDTIANPTQDSIEHALKQNPKWLLVETPTNPLMEISDIQALVQIAKQNRVLTIVDNTFATPYFQNPLKHGADAVWHSTTKYIGGHSDVIGGVVMTDNPEFKAELDFARMALGLNPSPFDTWLTNRGAKTLAVRMEQHQKNAMAAAEYLSKHKLVKAAYYPGLSSHPNYEIAKKQMSGYSGMVSAEFDLPLESILKLASSFKIFTLAESLGGVESLVCHPASMTHASIPESERARLGISDSLLRFSVGIEDASDLLLDIEQALAEF